MIGYFSIAGFFHRYYLSMLAPSIAALTGIGVVEMWKAYMGTGWKWVLLPSSLVVNAAVQGLILSRYSQWKGLAVIICVISVLAAAALMLIRLLKKDNLGKTIKITLIVGMAALVIAPAIWCYTPIMYGSQTQLPVAGPELKSGDGQFGHAISKNSRDKNSSSSELVKFLLSKKQNEKYLVAVPSSNSYASEIIIQTGESVMALGGFSGSDNILTLGQFKKLVSEGQIRYAITGGGGAGGNSEITNWIQQNGKSVSESEWNGSSGSSTSNNNSTDSQNQRFGGFGGSVQLYDLKDAVNNAS
jgi:4-amino-4-deoxy-L-arabinose transferase-like glycosyltransferase